MNDRRFDSLMFDRSNRGIVVHKMIFLDNFGLHDGVFFLLMILMSDMLIGMIRLFFWDNLGFSSMQ